MYQALSLKTGKPLPVCKTANDIILVIIAALLSLIFMGELNGVREGTVIAAVGIRPLLKVMTSFTRLVLQPVATEVSE